MSTVMENTFEPNSTAAYGSKEGAYDSLDIDLYKYQLVLESFIFLFGVPGNCLILFVYWSKPLKTSTHVFIMGLAWADLCVCLFSVNRIYQGAVIISNAIESDDFFNTQHMIWAFNKLAISASIIMTAVIAADRYDCVCRPHRRFFTYRRGKITAGAVLVLSLLMSVPSFIPRSINITLTTTVEQAFQTFNFGTALIMITVCYGKVYLTIKKHVRVDAEAVTRNQDCSREADERSTRIQTDMLTAVESNTTAVSTLSAFVSKPSEKVNACTWPFQGTSSYDVGVNESFLEEREKPRVGRSPTARMTRHTGTSKKTDPPVVGESGNPSKILRDAGNTVPKTDATGLQRKTTRMLFITSVVFLLTWLPYWMIVAAQFASYGNPVFYKIVGKFSLALYVNNAVNPLIYGLANRRFRKDCKLVFKKFKGC